MREEISDVEQGSTTQPTCIVCLRVSHPELLLSSPDSGNLSFHRLSCQFINRKDSCLASYYATLYCLYLFCTTGIHDPSIIEH